MATQQNVAPSAPLPTTGSQYNPDAYDICRPISVPPENETEAERIDRLQREFDVFRDCVNAELRVRAEASLLTLILLKVLLPFSAIAAGFSAIYIGILRAGSGSTHIERYLAIGYLIIVAGAILLWRTLRKPGSGGPGDSFDQSMRRALNLTVPPRKERLTRNRLVNRWIFFWLTWGLIIGLPLIFFIFRSDALERANLRLTFDTANVCAPTAQGYNPYEGSDVCENRGYTYVDPADAPTSSEIDLGAGSSGNSLEVLPTRTIDDYNRAEVRIDVTTTLVFYFIILIGGILVNMIRWVRRDKKRKQQIAAVDASSGTV